MGVPTLEVGYTSATTGWGDHEVHKGHVVGEKKYYFVLEEFSDLKVFFNESQHEIISCIVYTAMPLFNAIFSTVDS
jgi:hypothetical protein